MTEPGILLILDLVNEQPLERIMTRRVDFLIAGVQKAATTALHAFLSEHPEIYLPESKELHFFDNEMLDWKQPDYNRYYEHFAPSKPSQVCGEATPIYTYWVPAMKRIKAFNPNMKLVIVLRDPVARAFSQWRMEVLRGADSLGFSEAIRGGRQRVTDLAETHGCHRVYSYVERGFYSEQLTRVFQYFKQQSVLVLDHHDMISRYKETLERIVAFLDVSPYPELPTNRIIHSHQDSHIESIRAADAQYLREVFEADAVKLEMLTGKRLVREH
jgi:hypothetical protein